MVPRENKNNAYAKFGKTNEEYYGIFRTGLYDNNIAMDHVTVSCLVAWPLNESEAGGDHVLRETS